MMKRCGSVDSLDSAFSSPSLPEGLEPTTPHKSDSVKRNLEAEFDAPIPKKRISQVLPFLHSYGNRKCVRDNIHGTIEAHEVCLKIACTKHVRRLKNLKQLGTAYLVYPSATTSRYNHSLGVMHLARTFLMKLQEIHGDDLVDEKDILCAEIAGLLHDVGHGSFSHMFETFLNRAGAPGILKHEKMSVVLIDEIFNEKEIRPLLEKYEITARDIICIKEMVYGVLQGNTEYMGRDPEKHFLMRLVNNTCNGLDVDKLDYLMRDSTSIGEPCPDFLSRLLDNIRVVLTEDGKTELAFMHKVERDLAAVAQERISLHMKLYQHPKVKIFDEMLIDTMLAADPYLQFPTRSGGTVRLSEVTQDTHAFLSTFDEEILRMVEDSTDPRMGPAQHILHRINWRECYKIVASVSISEKDEKIATIRNSFTMFVNNHHLQDLSLGVFEIKVESGFKDNSLDNFFFINKTGKEVSAERGQFRVERTLVCFTRAEDPQLTEDAGKFFRKFVADNLVGHN